jgi:surfactin synthase thioesterase subunit
MPVGRPLTLYCFAHAGAGASCFHRWRGPVADGVRVVPMALPGRLGKRAARLTGRDEAVAALLPRLGPLEEPFAFYGHSLGGLIAYTLARALDTTDGRPPRPAFVAIGACAPPDAPALLPDGPAPDAAPEPDALLGRLTAAQRLDAAHIDDDLWRRAVLPVLRDDLRLAAALRTAARNPATGGRSPSRCWWPAAPPTNSCRPTCSPAGATGPPALHPPHGPRRPLLRPRQNHTGPHRPRLPRGAVHGADGDGSDTVNHGPHDQGERATMVTFVDKRSVEAADEAR